MPNDRQTSKTTLANIKKALDYTPQFAESEPLLPPDVRVMATPSIFFGRHGKILCARDFGGGQSDFLVETSAYGGETVRLGFQNSELIPA